MIPVVITVYSFPDILKLKKDLRVKHGGDHLRLSEIFEECSVAKLIDN